MGEKLHMIGCLCDKCTAHLWMTEPELAAYLPTNTRKTELPDDEICPYIPAFQQPEGDLPSEREQRLDKAVRQVMAGVEYSSWYPMLNKLDGLGQRGFAATYAGQIRQVFHKVELHG